MAPGCVPVQEFGFEIYGCGGGIGVRELGVGIGFEPGVGCLVFSFWCLVFGVWCLVSGVWCLISKDIGAGFTSRVQGWGFQGFGFRVSEV